MVRRFAMSVAELRDWVKNRHSGNPRYIEVEDAMLANLSVVDLHAHCLSCPHCRKGNEMPVEKSVPLAPFKPIIGAQCKAGKALKVGTRTLLAAAHRLAKEAQAKNG